MAKKKKRPAFLIDSSGWDNIINALKAVYEEEFQRAADEDEDRVSLKLQPDIQYLRV